MSSNTNGMEELFLDNKLRSLDLNLKSEQELAVKELYAGNNVLIWEKWDIPKICSTIGQQKKPMASRC